MDFFCQILLMSPKSLLTPDRHRPADGDDGYFLSFLPVFFLFLFLFFFVKKRRTSH